MDLNLNKEEPNEIISCKECEWIFPEELVRNLIKGVPVYCEKCGAEINRQGFTMPQLENYLKSFLSTVKKTVLSKVKGTLKKVKKKAKSNKTQKE